MKEIQILNIPERVTLTSEFIQGKLEVGYRTKVKVQSIKQNITERLCFVVLDFEDEMASAAIPSSMTFAKLNGMGVTPENR